jgi:hypothetical protein
MADGRVSATLASLCCRDSHLLSVASLLHRLALSKPPTLSALMGVVERIVGLSGHPQAVKQHREFAGSTATTARFLAFLAPREAIFSPWRLRSESEPKGPRM